MTEDTKDKNHDHAQPDVKDVLSITHHSVTIGGQTISYTVTTGTLVLKEEAEKEGDEAGISEGEKPRASVFFIAYTRDDTPDPRARPITFSFNGGPGSASVWMHLGVLGPRRVLLDEIGNLPPPPYRLVENEHSLLDVSDLVFIDPISTGYSRVVKGEKARPYHHFKKDIESVGDFIRLYVTRYGRWNSPKFLIGESYGTTRAGGLSGYLQDRHGMYLNGIMFVSAILNFITGEFDPGNDLPYMMMLPSYTATAWYHKRLPDDLQQRDLRDLLDEVEAFALREYALALLQGATLPQEERAAIVQQLARYTGLSPDYIDRAELRIHDDRYVKELLRDQRRTVGRLDSRFLGYDRDAVGERSEHDPSYATILGPYAGTFNAYIRGDLKFESDLPYEVLNWRVWPWNYSDFEGKYVEVVETLRRAMINNPWLKIFVANGYYDFATPYFATIYTLNHLGIDPSLRANISMGFYEAGHMMYTHLPSLRQLKADLANFVQAALPQDR
jgi:carboxypeptidase C (cathepsin A)